MWVHAVDSSFDLLTEEEAHRLKAAGVELYIQALTALPPTGLMQPENRVISLRNATYAGLKIAGYALLRPGPTPELDVDFARGGVPDDLWNALEFCAVDVEVGRITGHGVNLACLRMSQLLPGKPVVIYTNYNTWVNLMGNPMLPERTKLWNAYWDGKEDVDFATLPYGGWTNADVLLEQYSGGQYVEGQFADRNVWWVQDPEPIPEPEPATAFDWYRRLDGKLDEILSRLPK